MENEHDIDIETIRERLLEASDMGQEPKDRLWAVAIVLAIILLVLGGFLIEIRLYLGDSRDIGYQRNATDCLEIIVDNDRDFSLPKNCQDSQVVVHYPPEVCAAYFADVPKCGTEWSTP